jgi:IS5 family transposase
MKSDKLKINVVQRILSLSDDKLLKKISDILDKENIVGYDAHSNPITDEEFIADINDALKQLEEGTLETYSSEEVRQMILGKNNLTDSL